MSQRRRLLALVACTALACATGRAPGSIAPNEGEGGGAALAGKNDAELLAIATTAVQAGDHARAAAAFARIADAFPASPRAAESRFRAGLAYREMGRWDLALDRFREASRDPPGPDSREAAFLAAEALYQLGRRAEARAELDRLASRPDLAATDRARALTQRGVLELEDGEIDGAERSLEMALSTARTGDGEPRDDERYYPAKARFYLGEVVHARFEAIQLDPEHASGAELAQRLDHRATLLLSAQQRYLEAIRAGDAGWAVAAGARIGDMYDELQRDIMDAPLPPGLEGEAAGAYRHELRQRVRVLVVKAIQAYQETLDAARRTRVESAFAARAEEALARMHRTLAEIDAVTAAPATN